MFFAKYFWLEAYVYMRKKTKKRKERKIRATNKLQRNATKLGLLTAAGIQDRF